MVSEQAAGQSADPRRAGGGRGPLALTRRGLLVLPALAVAACSTGSTASSDHPSGAQPVATVASVANEADLIAQYDAVIAQFPPLAASLTPIRDQHRAHLTALGGDAAGSAPQASNSGPATEARSTQAALTQLAAAEKAAAQLRLQDCIAATGEPLIRILASIAASEASHVAELVGS